MTAVLFLDVDGVLNSSGTRRAMAERGWAWFVDPAPVARLLRVVAATGALVVLSSGWRRYPEHLPKLAAAGIAIHGSTPIGPEESPRARYISAWLAAHPEVERFAIVDDDGDAGDEHPSRFVRTDWRTGLTDAHADALIALLI